MLRNRWGACQLIPAQSRIQILAPSLDETVMTVRDLLHLVQ